MKWTVAMWMRMKMDRSGVEPYQVDHSSVEPYEVDSSSVKPHEGDRSNVEPYAVDRSGVAPYAVDRSGVEPAIGVLFCSVRIAFPPAVCRHHPYYTFSKSRDKIINHKLFT
jgi:hypothetical protein